MLEKEPVRIIRQPLLLVGVDQRYEGGRSYEALIAQGQAALQSKLDDIKNVVDASTRIRYFYFELSMEKRYHYLECVEVSALQEVPGGLTAKVIRPSEYAVFVEKNGMEGTAARIAREEWLPTSGYKENFALCGDLEVRYKYDNKTHEFWLPVIKG